MSKNFSDFFHAFLWGSIKVIEMGQFRTVVRRRGAPKIHLLSLVIRFKQLNLVIRVLVLRNIDLGQNGKVLEFSFTVYMCDILQI